MLYFQSFRSHSSGCGNFFMFPYAFLWRELKLYSYNSIDSRMLGKSKKREESESIIKKQPRAVRMGLHFTFCFIFASIIYLQRYEH